MFDVIVNSRRPVKRIVIGLGARNASIGSRSFCGYNTDMNSVDDILATAQALPSSERAKLIPLLWGKLAPDEWAAPFEECIQEAGRRSDEIDKGEMPLKSWNEAREDARRKAGMDG